MNTTIPFEKLLFVLGCRASSHSTETHGIFRKLGGVPKFGVLIGPYRDPTISGTILISYEGPPICGNSQIFSPTEAVAFLVSVSLGGVIGLPSNFS